MHIWIPAMLLLGCGGSDGHVTEERIAACIADHPEGPEATRDPAEIESITTACEGLDGTGCDPEGWLGEEAARCIALADGLPEGDSESYLGFDTESSRPTWVFEAGSAYRMIDAETGAIRSRGLREGEECRGCDDTGW